MIGRVTSTKLKNTVTVLVERTVMNPLYKKTFIQTKRYLVDDSVGVKEGDVVEIINCKPVSKRKHWEIVKVVGKNLQEITEEKLKKAAEEVIAEVMPEEKTEEQKVKEEKPKKKGEKNGTAQK